MKITIYLEISIFSKWYKQQFFIIFAININDVQLIDEKFLYNEIPRETFQENQGYSTLACFEFSRNSPLKLNTFAEQTAQRYSGHTKQRRERERESEGEGARNRQRGRSRVATLRMARGKKEARRAEREREREREERAELTINKRSSVWRARAREREREKYSSRGTHNASTRLVLSSH